MTEPLLPLADGDARVPRVTGGDTRHVALDYAASTPALSSVAEHVAELLTSYASVHRGNGYPSLVSTAVYESAKSIVAGFVGARDDDVAIVTRNTTDALNLLASVTPGPTLVLATEHHANLLPWRRNGQEHRILHPSTTVAQTVESIERALRARTTALVAVSGASNVTGETLPLTQLARIAHAAGARLAVDGAQLVPHRRVDMARDGVDYLAFSGHKLYAPYGAGFLIGRRDWLDAGEPYLAGGGAVRRVTDDDVEWREGAGRHEAGSPNVVGAAAVARAVRELAALGDDRWYTHERELRAAICHGLGELDGVRVLRLYEDSIDPVGVVTFTVDGVDPGLLSAVLSAEWGISVRDGRFCAHPLFDHLGVDGTALRASVGVGSRAADVAALLEAIASFRSEGARWTYRQTRGRWYPVDDPRPKPAWAADYAVGWRSIGTRQ